MTDNEIQEQDRVIAEAMADGVDPADAVRKAGLDLSDRNAKVLANHVWKKQVDGNNAMVEALAEVGVSPVVIAQKLKDKLDATQAIVVGRGDNAHVVEVDDNTTQLKAADMIMKTVGGYAPKKTEHVELKFEDILVQVEGLD